MMESILEELNISKDHIMFNEVNKKFISDYVRIFHLLRQRIVGIDIQGIGARSTAPEPEEIAGIDKEAGKFLEINMHIMFFGLADYYFKGVIVRCLDLDEIYASYNGPDFNWHQQISCKVKHVCVEPVCGHKWTAKGFANFRFERDGSKKHLFIILSKSKCNDCGSRSISSWYATSLIWLFSQIAKHEIAQSYLISEKTSNPITSEAFLWYPPLKGMIRGLSDDFNLDDFSVLKTIE